MRIISPLLALSSTAMGLTVTAIAIAVILLASNFTIINAQQSLTSQPGEIENGATTTFQNTDDSFRVQVPEGWISQDVNNTDSISEESTQGYGILAQLCAQEEQQQGAALSNVSTSGNTASCQGAQEEIVHIILYPDLETRMQQDDNLTTYHLQKLQEAGYNGIESVNSTDMTVNLANPQTNETITTVPAKFVEMTYSTTSAPDETRRGYFILTGTAATSPNQETEGYAIFYEGNSTTNSTAAAEIITATAASGSLPLPSEVAQIFDSFELIVAPEVAQALEAQGAETAEGGGNDEDDDDNGGNDVQAGEDDEDDTDDDDGGGDDDTGGTEEGGGDGGTEEGGGDGGAEEGGGDGGEGGQGMAERIVEDTIRRSIG